ncbi:MAG TPA: PHP domain-containing protein [Acidimicrobiales bacterium]|nr:PHP domain-containing protein [Acidimicrobiales bacterium]
MIDLHAHSSVSDGSDPPERIAELAAAAGCRAVALTDHDRLDGVPAAAARAAALGVELVPGCELSCQWSPGTMHVLVYFVEPGEGALQRELERLQKARDERNQRLAERLAELGLPVTHDELVEEAGGSGVGRPHAAAVLVRKGLATSVQDAFDRWLAKGKPGYVERERLAPDDAARLVAASGGVAVLAHPLTLGLEPPELERTVEELAGLGFAGLEAVYASYAPEEREGLLALARRHDLVATGGSDYHGTYKPDLYLGSGRGDLAVPDELLDALAARKP